MHRAEAFAMRGSLLYRVRMSDEPDSLMPAFLKDVQGKISRIDRNVEDPRLRMESAVARINAPLGLIDMDA